MRLQTAAGWRSLLYSTLLLTGAWAKKDKPSVKSTRFEFIPYNINYFDDSDVMLFEDPLSHNIYRSEDAGETWNMLEGAGQGDMLELSMHPFDNKKAYIITGGKTHYKTSDRGKSWEEFEVDALASLFRPALSYHAGDPDRIIFNGMDCTGIFCDELTLYTKDGFSKKANFLRSDTSGCHWAKTSALFTTGQDQLNDDRILCVCKGRFSPWRKDFRLLISDDFFQQEQEFEPELEPGRTVQGIVNMAVVTKYLIVAASAEGTDEMALYISDDTIKWHRAIFPHDHKLVEEAYTVLEGTNYSIQIDVMNSPPGRPMGVFLSSNSNGTYFTRNIEHTNRDSYGLVDFEKIYGIQGIVLVNVVDNWEEVEATGAGKKIKSKISFDDGRTWHSLKADKKDLHIHSVTDLSNSGRVFSSPAPGLVMGIGNTGDYLKNYDQGDLYVSDDAGLTWRQALDGPHKYEFGDQGSILLAIKDDGMTDEVKFSLDHGISWKEVELPEKIKPVQLTTTQDSTSLKFLIEAIDGAKPSSAGYIIALDFDDMHEAQCKDDDLEVWNARLDDDGNPSCLMGHTQTYRRRKADHECFLKKEFEDPLPESHQCDCTDADFECDFNFIRDGDDCRQVGAYVLPPDACKAFGPGDTFKASSGWRLIPGNDCKRQSGPQKDDLVDKPCETAATPPASGKIEVVQESFAGQKFLSKVYLERTGVSTGEDETVLFRTDHSLFMSEDHGKTFNKILDDEGIVAIYPHPYFNDMVFFLTGKKTVFYSTDRGKNIRSFDAPTPPNDEGLAVMNFHPKNKDWIIWIGAADCGSKEGCHSVAYITTDRGGKWEILRRYVKRCEFIRETETLYQLPPPTNSEEKRSRDKLIYCEVRERESNDRENNPWNLVSSDDFFNDDRTVHFKDVIEFATMSEFVVVATKDEEHQTMKVSASADGLHFADANFPYGFTVPHQMGYTVLDSSTHSIFLLVLVNKEAGFEYGSLIKSNSNGTSYTMSLTNVDLDAIGYVDFEKMFGIEGVAMVNIVANVKAKDFTKDGKLLKTVITHNDGGEWDYLTPPKLDAEGKKFGCSGSTDNCALHIHGYTERLDKSHTYSSSSAIGLMFGTGNVGEYLSEPKNADTFMSSDAGLTWKSVKKGAYMWEFLDQGSVLVIVKERSPTNVIYYSRDEGDTWLEYKFSEKEIRIDDITTVPSDNSRNVMLWGSDDGQLLTFSIDFSGLTDKQCTLDESDVEGGDYYLWTPKHPKLDNDCLFGHVSQYHRKRLDSDCYNGRMIPHLHNIARNCTCTRQDFECDYNYERQKDGSCQLVPGFQPPDHSLICQLDENLFEYDDPTGYRRLPSSTCEGGNEFDKSVPRPCPGKEDEFNKKHRASAAGIFFAITIPFLLAGGAGYYVWKNWANKFGQIRLGEQSSFDSDAPYIKYPVLAVSAVAAVVVATPLLIASLWRSLMTAVGRTRTARFTTRDSFARGRGDYAVVDEDEGELLGDESDEEV